MHTRRIVPSVVDRYSEIQEAQDLIREIFLEFGDRAAIGTSGQLSGMVILDLAIQAGITPRMFTVDTHRLFPESYKFFDKVEQHYGIKIERFRPPEQELNEMLKEDGEFLFFDSKEKQEKCCHIRKVLPNQEALDGLDVWLTGLRRDQSRARRDVARLQIIEHGEQQRPILKVAPLFKWKEKQLRSYIKEHQVPTHPLLEWSKDGWYYESLGCTLCTTPIGPFESRRAGRWRWFNALDPDANKECGIHIPLPEEIK